jgi:hypothetical protein
MAKGLYKNGVTEIMKGNIDLVNSTISAVLLDKTYYTVDLTNDTDLSDIAAAAELSHKEMSGKTVVGTVFRANDTTFSSVTGTKADAIVLYLDNDTEEASTLIYYADDPTEFPITPDGTDITIAWDTGANGIVKFF